MRCSVARLCERTVGRRVPLLGAGRPAARSGWRPTAHYSALCRSYRFGCGAGELREPDWKGGSSAGAELRRSGAHSLAAGAGAGGASLRLATVRSRELCEALELAPVTLQADHLRFFTSNHSRPVAATINTTMMLQGVDEVGCSLTAADFTISLLLMSKGLF